MVNVFFSSDFYGTQSKFRYDGRDEPNIFLFYKKVGIILHGSWWITVAGKNALKRQKSRERIMIIACGCRQHDLRWTSCHLVYWVASTTLRIFNHVSNFNPTLLLTLHPGSRILLHLLNIHQRVLHERCAFATVPSYQYSPNLHIRRMKR